MRPPRDPSLCAESTRAWWSRRGFVYFIAAGDPAIAVKIGMLSVPKGSEVRIAVARRLAQLQCSNHERLRLLGVLVFEAGEYPTRDAEARERELHLRFGSDQIGLAQRRGAAWFRPSAELMKFSANETATTQ